MAVDIKNLDTLNLSSLNKKGAMASSGEPLTLSLDSIDEDVSQPRTEFNLDELKTLADDIKQRGVISPISVRQTENDRYLINFGARRYRASKLAGLTTIPAFIDNAFQPGFSQLAENIHRSNHTAMEIAKAIKQKLDEGISKKDIAAALSKKDSFVTNHLALLEMPFYLKKAYEMGLVKDAQTIYLANTLCKKDGTDSYIGTFVTTETPITRKAIQDYLNKLKVEKENQKKAEETKKITSTEEDNTDDNYEITFDEKPNVELDNVSGTNPGTDPKEQNKPSDENKKLFNLYDEKSENVDERYLLNVHHPAHGNCYLLLIELPFGEEAISNSSQNQTKVKIYKDSPAEWSESVPLSELTIISVDIVDV